MNDGFLVFDADMHIRYSNERFCAMIARPLSDIVGRSFYDFVDDDQVKALRQHLDADRHRDFGPQETVLTQNDGKRIHVYISPATLYGDDGAIDGRFSVVTDISRMKAMEAALRESEEMTRALLDACRDAVVMLKPDGSIFMANEMMAMRLGVETTALKGRNIFDYLRADQNASRRRFLSESVGRREPVIFEDQFDDKHYLIHTYPINDDKPSVERIAVFARDITELKNAEKHIHSLSQELIKVQERERQRISRDLHDNVAQELATMKITCDTLFPDPRPFPADVVTKVSGLSRILQGTIMNVRNLAYDLRPPGLDQLGLVRTMTNYCEDFAQRNAIAVDFFSAGLSGLSLSADTEINLYRIVQEALHNVIKHARASQVTIRLIASFPTIILRIEDNGRGFDINERLSEACAEKRMGVRSMEERARLLSGTIEFRSHTRKGTRIKVEIPMIDNVVNHNDREACLNG
jgi:PAS domain S-box-containing protein